MCWFIFEEPIGERNFSIYWSTHQYTQQEYNLHIPAIGQMFTQSTNESISKNSDFLDKKAKHHYLSQPHIH